MTAVTPNTRLARHPDSVGDNRSRGRNARGLVSYDNLKADQRALIEAETRMAPYNHTGLLTTDGSNLAIALYDVDIAAGSAFVGGYYKRWAAATDQVLIGAGQDIETYKLDGTAAAVLTADGKTYWCAIVAIVVNGAVELRAVVGDEADDASEEAITPAQINTALRAASITNHDPDVFLVLDRIKIQRVATDTMTLTHTDPASDDTLAGERGRGYSLAAS